MVAACYGACICHTALATAGLALAAYMVPQNAVLLVRARGQAALAGLSAALSLFRTSRTRTDVGWGLVPQFPVACLLANGPEDVATPLSRLGLGAQPAPPAAASVPGAAPLPADSSPEARFQYSGLDAGPSGDGSRPLSAPGARPPGAGDVGPAHTPAPAHGPAARKAALPWRVLLTACAATALWTLLLWAASDAYLAAGTATPRAAPHGCLLGLAGALAGRSVPLPGSVEGGPGLPGRLRGAAAALRSCWAARVYRSGLLLDDATPGLGQWWYLSMEAFPDTQVRERSLLPA